MKNIKLKDLRHNKKTLISLIFFVLILAGIVFFLFIYFTQMQKQEKYPEQRQINQYIDDHHYDDASRLSYRALQSYRSKGDINAQNDLLNAMEKRLPEQYRTSDYYMYRVDSYQGSKKSEQYKNYMKEYAAQLRKEGYHVAADQVEKDISK